MLHSLKTTVSHCPITSRNQLHVSKTAYSNAVVSMWDFFYSLCIINPRHMREGYGSHFVCLYSVLLTLSTCIMWILLKTLCLSVLASFANAKLLDFSPYTVYHQRMRKGCGSAGSDCNAPRVLHNSASLCYALLPTCIWYSLGGP